MNYKFIVVDDEPLARKLILSHTEKIQGLELVAQCSNAIEAGYYLRSHTADLIFLDIQLPELNGLEFLRTLKNPPAVIFTTAYRDYAPDAFDSDAVDYLVKPIAFERMLRAVNKFFDRTAASASSFTMKDNDAITSILIKADRKIHKIALGDIIYVESLDDFVKIHLHNTVLISRENISTLETRLSGSAFVRIHRSYLVSVKFISAISSDGVEITGKLLPFGRTYKLAALSVLGLRS
ncbi:MAG TPA: LytTR family DNA-binding domain-containing protein [Ohtaekwangia sp.]|nr:LytTR family DNA-binding domain-containing protein [Ohtaekwangia sp.]